MWIEDRESICQNYSSEKQLCDAEWVRSLAFTSTLDGKPVLNLLRIHGYYFLGSAASELRLTPALTVVWLIFLSDGKTWKSLFNTHWTGIGYLTKERKWAKDSREKAATTNPQDWSLYRRQYTPGKYFSTEVFLYLSESSHMTIYSPILSSNTSKVAEAIARSSTPLSATQENLLPSSDLCTGCMRRTLPLAHRCFLNRFS